MFIESAELNIGNVTGIVIELTRSHSRNFPLIRNCWKIFNKSLHEIENRVTNKNWVKYGITLKENNKYFYMSAIPFKDDYNLPQNFIIKEISQTIYFTCKHHGEIQNLPNTINEFYRNMPENFQNENPLKIIELYDENFTWSYNSVIQLFVPQD